ncbi:MAG: ABC transporter permease, partial [Thermodesulfovibrio sp.]|nr:ABC transporter permease [Thermodesulfovibrio sp.]
MISFIKFVGRYTIDFFVFLGKMFIFLIDSIYNVFLPPFKFRNFLRQLRFFCNKSMILVIFTGAYSGMV